MESGPEFTADPQFTVFSKSINPLNLLHKSTIHTLYKAKSVGLKTYSLRISWLDLLYVILRT